MLIAHKDAPFTVPSIVILRAMRRNRLFNLKKILKILNFSLDFHFIIDYNNNCKFLFIVAMS